MTEARKALARRIAFLAIAAFIVGGPWLKQAVGLRIRYVPAWRMFHAVGVGTFVMAVETDDGADIDWTRDPKGGRYLQRLRSAVEAEKVFERLCKDRVRPNLVMRLREAKKSGWELVAEQRCP